jgi:hypothetical protein
MSEHQRQLRAMAEHAVENAECGAQLEIKDEVLREALIEAIRFQLSAAYQWAAAS